MPRNPLRELQPTPVWQNFARILAVPHGSGNEAALARALKAHAKSLGAQAHIDPAGNLLVRIPASAGFEHAPTVVVQGHLDMVCEKNTDTVFDFDNDPIQVQRDGDWLTAVGTTLGADNGIGVAMGLAILEDPDIIHGPIELLCTVEEETGLNGALALSPTLLKGRILLNLDSEDEGVFFVGCAGGRDTHLTCPLRVVPAQLSSYQVAVSGLRGGHSGLDIAHNRANALKLLARALNALRREVSPCHLSHIEGGDKHNAIPREARAVVQLNPSDAPAAAACLARLGNDLLTEFRGADAGISLTIARTFNAQTMLEEESAHRLLHLISALPTGVLAMSREMPGLVETSTQLARIRTLARHAELLLSSRSACRFALEATVDQIDAIAALARAQSEAQTGYPGWRPDMSSFLVDLSRDTWRAVHGETPLFTAVHAGLECGILKEKYPGMEVISFGPTIQNPHSPDERVSIASVAAVYDFFKAFLHRLALRPGTPAPS